MSNFDFEFDPKQAAVSTEAGYRVPSNLYMLGKACDAWLQKRYNAEGRKWTSSQWAKSGGKAPETATQQLARKIRAHAAKSSKPEKKSIGSITVPREPKTPKPQKPPKPYQYRERKRVLKYATSEERKAAVAAATSEAWKRLTPEQREARLQKMRRKPKDDVPRHKRESWKAYKREWDRKRRAEEKLTITEAELEKRRAAARRQYAAKDPAIRKAQSAERRARYNAKLKAKKAAVAALKAAA